MKQNKIRSSSSKASSNCLQFDVTSTVYAIPYGRGKIKRVEIELYTTVNMVITVKHGDYRKGSRDRSRSILNSASLSFWSSIRHSRYWSGDRLWRTWQSGRSDKIVAFNTQLSSGLIILSVSKRSKGQTCWIRSQIILKASSFIYMFIQIKEWLDLYTSW